MDKTKGLIHIGKISAEQPYAEVEIRTDTEVIRVRLDLAEYARLTFGEAIVCEIIRKELQVK